MTYNGRAMAERPPAVLDFGAFGEPPSPLFRDYLAGAAPIREFYPDQARWDLAAVARSADRALQYPRQRARLAEVLAAQQRSRGAEAAAANAARLAEADAVAVVTGQQPILFGGPLFVLYKALAAERVAAALERERGRSVVPVFWVAADDHDFAEIRSTSTLDASAALRTFRYSPADEPVAAPASRIVLDPTIAGLIEELAAALPDSGFRDDFLRLLRSCYVAGSTLAEAFSRLVSGLLPGLVVLDPSDAGFKALLVPVLERELVEASPTSRLAADVGERLLGSGYHQQVPVREGFFNLFMLDAGQRRALGLRDGQVEIRGTNRTRSLADAQRMLSAEPALFSPGALLRPLAQDHALPTAAYVGGPAEIAYHAQIGPSYAHFGIPRPTLAPRPSATLVEPGQARALEAEDVDLAALQADPEILLARWAREANPGLEEAFGRVRDALVREMQPVERALSELDPTLVAAADGARGRALHQLDTLHEKALRALKRRDQTRADRLRRTRDALFPGGGWQERELGLVGPLARYGPGLIEQLRAQVDPWALGHQVLFL